MKRTFETMCGMSPRLHELTVDGPLYKYVANNNPDGIIPVGYAGIGIWLVDGYGDECIAAWMYSGCDGARRHCINYTDTGRAYIRKGGRRWYLDDAMRVA